MSRPAEPHQVSSQSMSEKPSLQLPPELILSMPASPADAAIFLDANLTKPELQRQDNDDWYQAVRQGAYFRVPGFPRAYDALARHLDVNGELLRATLSAECKTISEGISWITGDFGTAQIDRALKGDHLQLQKAIVLVLGVNELISKRIDGVEDDKAREDLASFRFGPHSIVSCTFFFFDVYRVYQAVQNDLGSKHDVLGELSERAGQPRSVIRELIEAPVNARKATVSAIDRASSVMASYPTLRTIFKYFEQQPAGAQILGTRDRTDWIQRLHVGSGKKKSSSEEKISFAKKITRPPYDWDREPGEALYPGDSQDDLPET